MIKKIINFLLVIVVILPTIINATFATNEVTEKYIKVSDDLTFFYHDVGNGSPIIFIPGWTMSSNVFKFQIDYFSKKFRVIALDPRSQGRSTITLENNNYTQHGIDLAHFIELLNLKNVILVGWSWGCDDAYSYIRLKGVSNIKALVCIDVSPKVSGKKDEWTFAEYENWGASLFQPMIYHRYQFTQAWAQSMFERKLNSSELDWLTKESFRTPTYAAIELAVDGIYADYRAEAILLEKNKLPVLNFISVSKSKVGKRWLQKNTPHTQIIIMGKHMMFFEHPDDFNRALDKFLYGLNKNDINDRSRNN